MNKRFLFLGLLLPFFVAVLPAGETDNEKGEIIQVTGVVRLVGTSAFPEIVIYTPDRRVWYIPNEEAGKLRNLQQETVTVEGEQTIVRMNLLSGHVLTRRYLNNIRIISAGS